MNGPFYVREYLAEVRDAGHTTIARGEGADEATEGANAEMICNALNAVFYAQKAAKATTSQGEGTS